MSPVILLALFALAAPQEDSDEPGVAPGAPIAYGGPAYQQAFDRAQRYEADGRTNRYRDEAFGPALNQAMTDILRGCVGPASGARWEPFVVVLSLDAEGAVDGVFAHQRTPQSQCMAEGLSRLNAPRPPVPDFAEEIRVQP